MPTTCFAIVGKPDSYAQMESVTFFSATC